MPKKIVNQLVTKYNVCVFWYIREIEKFLNEDLKLVLKETEYNKDSEIKYREILTYIKNTLDSEDFTIKKNILQFVKSTLGKFSDTYDVNVMMNIDDFKIIYFISLYFVRENEITKNKKELNILFYILHKLFCHLLITQKPLVILNKFNRFFLTHDYFKIKDEYGDIGYYHTIKSIYLMQKEIFEDLIINGGLDMKDPFIMNYLKGKSINGK